MALSVARDARVAARPTASADPTASITRNTLELGPVVGSVGVGIGIGIGIGIGVGVGIGIGIGIGIGVGFGVGTGRGLGLDVDDRQGISVEWCSA